MGNEVPLWSCFVLIARVYSPFVLFLYQNFVYLLFSIGKFQFHGDCPSHLLHVLAVLLSLSA
jgi:hypothetical protein